MSSPNLEAASLADLRTLAERAARAGGAVARDAFAQPPGVRLKADASVVTDADIAAQAAVVRIIRAARPQDWCIGEEGPIEGGGGGGGFAWLIDPIDGTRNFVRGSPAFACSVGVLRAGLPVAGAIYEPQRDTMYSAHLGGGLRVNGQVRDADLAERGPSGPPGELVVSLPSSATPAVGALMHACVDRWVIRNVGSAALHLAMVATGELDAALLATCKLWDLAAGAALLAAGGGAFLALDGQPLFPIDVQRRAAEELPSVAGRTPEIARQVLACLRR
jgi:myo-inositol-1(or 4)-monophosphatase